MPIRDMNADLPDLVILESKWKAEDDHKIVSKIELTAFEDEYRTGVVLAMIGKTILEGLCKASRSNPNLMEQAMAGMAEGFANEMRIP